MSAAKGAANACNIERRQAESGRRDCGFYIAYEKNTLFDRQNILCNSHKVKKFLLFNHTKFKFAGDKYGKFVDLNTIYCYTYISMKMRKFRFF